MSSIKKDEVLQKRLLIPSVEAVEIFEKYDMKFLPPTKTRASIPAANKPQDDLYRWGDDNNIDCSATHRTKKIIRHIFHSRQLMTIL